MNYLYWAALVQSLQEWTTNFRYVDLLDMLIVAFLVYAALTLVKRMRSFFIFTGITILFVLYLLAHYFNLYLTNIILQAFLPFLVVIFVIIFQREFRSFIEWLAVWGKLSHLRKEKISELVSHQILQAVAHLAKNKIGALIVFAADQPIDSFLGGGVVLNGKVSVPLVLSLFDPSSPGHDGAILIEGDRIKKFGVHLPLAEKFEKYGNLGTRHRAALGLSEASDALIIVVSEERGTISIAQYGELKQTTETGVHKILTAFLREKFFHEEKRPWHFFLSHNLREKTTAVLVTLVLWLVFVVQSGASVTTRQLTIPIDFRFLPDNYVIDDLEPSKVNITLSGRGQNFDILDPENIKVVIDATTINEDFQRVKLTENNITAPPALSIVDFSPHSILFRLKKK